MTYFGFAIADSMFPVSCDVIREPLTVNQVRDMLLNSDVKMCLNPSHKPTIDVARERFGLDISIPEKPPMVNLVVGDTMIVMSVRGLPRLEGRHEYTTDEIDGATFSFGEWVVFE